MVLGMNHRSLQKLSKCSNTELDLWPCPSAFTIEFLLNQKSTHNSHSVFLKPSSAQNPHYTPTLQQVSNLGRLPGSTVLSGTGKWGRVERGRRPECGWESLLHSSNPKCLILLLYRSSSSKQRWSVLTWPSPFRAHFPDTFSAPRALVFLSPALRVFQAEVLPASSTAFELRRAGECLLSYRWRTHRAKSSDQIKLTATLCLQWHCLRSLLIHSSYSTHAFCIWKKRDNGLLTVILNCDLIIF